MLVKRRGVSDNVEHWTVWKQKMWWCDEGEDSLVTGRSTCKHLMPKGRFSYCVIQTTRKPHILETEVNMQHQLNNH